MKKQDLKNVLSVIDNAKFTKLSSADVVKIIKETRKMRPHVEQLQKDLEMLEKSFEDEKTKEMREKAKAFDTLLAGEQVEVNEYFIEHHLKFEEAKKNLNEEDVSINITKLTTDILKKLIESNDFTGQQLDYIFNVFA